VIQLTSMAAYDEIREQLPEKARPVLDCIMANPGVCIGEIGRILGMQNSSVSGRVNDLIDLNLVQYGEKKLSPITRKSVYAIKPNILKYSPPKPLEILASRQVLAVQLDMAI
jgi:predicted transcriptional regulator